MRQLRSFLLFFFNDTATTEIYTLSLHDALPISSCSAPSLWGWSPPQRRGRHALRRFADAHSSPGCFLLRLARTAFWQLVNCRADRQQLGTNRKVLVNSVLVDLNFVAALGPVSRLADKGLRGNSPD